LLKAQFSKRLKQIERDLMQVDTAILSVIAQDEGLSQSAEILTSIPGIATVTACAMLTEMPELGNISGKQATSLAGLAPPLGPLLRNALPGNECHDNRGSGRGGSIFVVVAQKCDDPCICRRWSQHASIPT